MGFSYAVLAAGIALGVVGQIVLKYGTERSEGGVLGQLLHPLTIAGLGVYFAAALCYILALKRIPLSVAYPSISVSYVVVALAAHLLWGEAFGLQQLLALGLIIGGIVVLFH